MKRKLLGGLVFVLVVVLGAWLIWFRGGGDGKPQDGAGSARSGKVVATGPHAPDAQSEPAPRGRTPRWSLDVDPQGPLQLEGQVLGPDGKGVAGAEVWLSSVPPRTAKTEDDGTFSFDKLVGRSYKLGARQGKLVGELAYKLTEKSDPAVIRIAEGARVKVTVVDDDHHGVAGAEVKTGEQELTAQTDAKGEAMLEPVHPGWITVSASAAGYAPNASFTSVGSAGAQGQLTIVLRKGQTVSGRVVDEGGKPVAKARVFPVSASFGFGEGDGNDPPTTDDKGQFTIPALATGNHILAAIDGVHAPARSEPFAVADKPVTGIEIKMQTGGVVAGVVVDAAGKPAPYATVKVAGAGEQLWWVAARQATSDKAGKFEVGGLVRAKLQARAESDTAASKLVEVDLTAKPAVRDTKLVLDVTGAIAGVVVDDKGAPVPEVSVHAFADILAGGDLEVAALAGMSSAITDGVGAFTIRGVPDGQYRLWAARSSAAREWGRKNTPAKAGDTNVRIVLPADGNLTGKVAIEGAGAPKLAYVQAGYQPATPTGDGAFALRDLQPGNYDITVRGPEFAELIKHDVKVEPGKTTDLGTLTVARGRKVTGTVVDASGRGVAGARVKLGDFLVSSAAGNDDRIDNAQELAGIRATVTDRDGAFTLIGVPKKATQAMADAPSGRSAAIPVPEGADDPPPLTLTLRGFGSVSGKVMQKGKPLAHVAVSDSSKDGGKQLSVAQTDDNGVFHFPKITEGAHVLQAIQAAMMGTSMKTASVTVTVTAGRESQVTIDIPVGAVSLTVQVKALPGNQVDWAQEFLFAGTVAPTDGKALLDAFLAGGSQGMKFWFGEGKPMPEFDELVPGDYSVCGVPLTGGKPDDIQFQQRVAEHKNDLKVYCKPVKLLPAPAKQTFVHELPSMTPLPPPTN